VGAKVEAICGWDGSTPIPLRQYAKILDASLVIGERYLTTFEPLSSIKSRSHYFATISDIFSSWPETHPRQFTTPDALRKWALIRCGFRTERQFATASKAEARRLATFLAAGDEYAELSVADNVIIEWKALSQKAHAMGREQFGRSKTEVLAFLAGEVRVTVESLAPPREEAPMREDER
jgi:hypothetical protein